MTTDEDYRRLSAWIEKNWDKGQKPINRDSTINGREWEQLTRKEKQSTIYDIIRNCPNEHTAEKLSRGIDYIRGNTKDFSEKEYKNKKGNKFKIIRDSRGKIFKWIKL